VTLNFTTAFTKINARFTEVVVTSITLLQDTEVNSEYGDDPIHVLEFMGPPNKFGREGVNEILDAVAIMRDEEFQEAIDGVIRLRDDVPRGDPLSDELWRTRAVLTQCHMLGREQVT